MVDTRNDGRVWLKFAALLLWRRRGDLCSLSGMDIVLVSAVFHAYLSLLGPSCLCIGSVQH